MLDMLLNFSEDCFESTIYAFEYQSSDLKWCEYSYQYSPNIIEFWNCLTSLFISVVGLFGLCYSSRSARMFYLMLIFIGIASAYFHSTLSFAGQLLDELGITAMMLMANYTIYYNDNIGLNIISICGIIQLLIQFTYSKYNRFVLFLYAILFINKFCVGLKAKDKKTKFYSYFSVGLFFASVVCWICDFYVCENNTFFNFHAIWHIFIAFVAYFTIETCLLIINSEQKLPTSTKETHYDEIVYLF